MPALKDKELRQLLDRYVKIVRSIKGCLNTYGYLLGYSKELVLIRPVAEFHLDGYQVFRRRNIRKLLQRKVDRYFENMLAKEGVAEQVGPAPAVDLDDWPALLKSLKKAGQNVIVEGEDPDLDEFKIGRIVRVRTNLTLLHFDALGRWQKKTTRIPLADITTVQWGGEYVNVFSKYVK